MYNCFAAQKMHDTFRQSSLREKKARAYHLRYHSELKPGLVDRYNRRINGFAKKMEDGPIAVSQEGPIPAHQLFRNPDMRLNVSNAQFRFKTADDWKSIFTPTERQDREQQLRENKRKDGAMVFRSIWSQSPYTSKAVDFRGRDSSKDINPPMKYTNKNSLLALASLPHMKNKKIKLLKAQQKTTSHISRTSMDSDGRESQIGNVSETDIISLYNNLMSRRGERFKTEREIEQEEELKALPQNKLYFKSLVDLEQNIKDPKEKQAMKQILIKCKVFRKPKKEAVEEEDRDNFLQLMRQSRDLHS